MLPPSGKALVRQLESRYEVQLGKPISYQEEERRIGLEFVGK